jgi:hypothetical protein
MFPNTFLWVCFGFCLLSIFISISLPFTDLSFRSTFKENRYAERPFLEEFWDKKTKFFIIVFLLVTAIIHLSIIFSTSFGLRIFPISVDRLDIWDVPSKETYMKLIFVVSLIKTLFMPLIGTLLDKEHNIFYDVKVDSFYKLVLKLPFHYILCTSYSF